MSDNLTEAEFLGSYSLEAWPRPSVTVDVAVLTVRDGALHALLIQRQALPDKGAWALPGGFVLPNESLVDTGARVLRTKAGLAGIPTVQVGAFADPGRDPRGWIISIAHLGAATAPDLERAVAQHGDEMHLARLEPHENGLRVLVKGDPVTLAFDHAAILGVAVDHLRASAWHEHHVLHMVPEPFTYGELQAAFEAVLGHPIDRMTFRRRLDDARESDEQGGHASGWQLIPAGRRRDGGRARPAELWISRAVMDHRRGNA